MAASFRTSLFQFVFLVAGVLFAGTEAGLATPFVAPVATAYTFAAPVPVQGVLRTAYSQVVGRSYAPSFVPVASSLAYAAAPASVVAAPVVRAVPAVYAAAPQLVQGPVLKTVRPYAAPLAVEAPVAYAAPAVAAVPAVRAALPAFAPSVLSTRLAPLPTVGVSPALSPVPATSLPGVVEARSAPAPVGTSSARQPAFVTAFGSPQGIRLVGGGSAFEGPALAGLPTNVDIARAAPRAQDGAEGRSAAPSPAASTPETFGVPQQTPFAEYGPPAAPSTPANP